MGEQLGRQVEMPGEPSAPLSEVLNVASQPEVTERLRADLNNIADAERKASDL